MRIKIKDKEKNIAIVDEKSAKRIVLEVVQHDCYGLSQLPHAPDVVLDIGANIGIFSLYARELFPDARVWAFEPNDNCYRALYENCSDLGVVCIQKALGPLGKLFSIEGRTAIHGCCISEVEKLSRGESISAIPVESAPLDSLIEDLKVDCQKSKVLIKVDCEGGEAVLVNSPAQESLISQAYTFVGEIHNFQKAPIHRYTLDEYRVWFQKFADSHHITLEPRGRHMIARLVRQR